MSDLYGPFFRTLQQTQWLPAHDLHEYQWRLTERLCRHAALTTPFYRDRLAPLFSGGDAASGDFRREAWIDIPVFDRAAAQVAGDSLFATEVPAEVGPTRVGTTSGSTGRPMQYRVSQFMDISGTAAFARCLDNAGLSLSATLGRIKSDIDSDSAAPDGSSGINWNGVEPGAPWFGLAASSTIAECCEWLSARRPDILVSYPSIVAAMMRRADRDGWRPPGLAAVVSLGEPLPPAFAAQIGETFGARHLDIYGAQEVGAFAHQCPMSISLHVDAEIAKVEILRSDGSTADVGEPGRIVATALYSYAMPMIRYDVGDVGIAGAPCLCGRHQPVLDKILGRSRDVLTLPGGIQRWPRGLNVVARHIDLLQVQVVQTAVDALDVRYVAGPSGRADLNAAAVVLRDALHPDLVVRFTAVPSIERDPSGKFRDFVALAPDAK